MIYPEGIVDFVFNDVTLKKKFAKDIEGDSLNVSAKIRVTSSDFEYWMVQEGQYQSHEIKRYLYFIVTMGKIFNNIARFFNKVNSERENEKEKDRFTMGTSPQEMLYIARYLYYLDSYAVEGNVLECGCFKGFSSCCLSWACNLLGRRLIIADSFQGLPQSGYEEESAYFKKHDYKGELDEVKETIRTLGRIENVEFVPGWYCESLPNFNSPLCLIWMDVDLYQSVLDVLNNVYNNLAPGGVVFSHEFEEIQVKNGIIQDQTRKNVLKAINDFFKSRGISHKAKFLIKRTGIVVPNTEDEILLSRDKQQVLLGLIDDKQKKLHETQIYTDEVMLVLDFLKKVPFVRPIIKIVTNLLRRRRK